MSSKGTFRIPLCVVELKPLLNVLNLPSICPVSKRKTRIEKLEFHTDHDVQKRMAWPTIRNNCTPLS